MGNCSDVRRELERLGLLMLQDKKLPGVVGIITGQSLSTSWWSHARGSEIFACLNTIEADAVATRLIGGKVTFVHRRLWPALLAVATSKGRWQKVPRGATPKEIQEHLAMFAEEIHTESGRHEMRLHPWSAFAQRYGVKAVSVEAGARELEEATAGLGAPLSMLPWHRFTKR